MVTLSIESGNVLTFQADVLALKYARAFHGADQAVADALLDKGLEPAALSPETGHARLVGSRTAVGAPLVLFFGVPSLRSFRYPQIRSFATEVMRIVAAEVPRCRHLALTLHGVNYGLDENESLLALVGGLRDAIQTGRAPLVLERVSIVERRPDRVARLRKVLAEHLAASGGGFGLSARRQERADPAIEKAGAEKPHVFVAMPFVEQKEDVFYYGIQGPVHGLGLSCERIDAASFTGDIVGQIKLRIDTAALVIADLSLANPNVYLEVGYAWGRGRPTLLLVDDLETLRFDVKQQRCIVYKSIKQLEARLTEELRGLREGKLF
jgi:hypothetical protein